MILKERIKKDSTNLHFLCRTSQQIQLSETLTFPMTSLPISVPTSVRATDWKNRLEEAEEAEEDEKDEKDEKR